MAELSQSRGLEERCWVCEGTELTLYRDVPSAPTLTSEAFRITDSNYGVTGRLLRCATCGFIQVSEPADVVRFYEALEDPEYEATRSQRGFQARKLLEWVGPLAPGARLLDVGAGSGILVEQALARGLAAEGVEPSAWLVRQAESRGLPVRRGVLPHPEVQPGYDLVTLVDVIEHVTDPVGLLRQSRRLLRPGGRLLVVTPDASSLAARLLGRRWWHYRVAHVGYFDRRSLDTALQRAGFRREKLMRPSWYFPVDYVWQRLGRYLKLLTRVRLPPWVRNATVPVNPLDSLAVTYRIDDR